MTIYSSIIVVETPDGPKSVSGPMRNEVSLPMGGWSLGANPTTQHLFIADLEKVMNRGFYQYEPGKWGRIQNIETFLDGVNVALLWT